VRRAAFLGGGVGGLPLAEPRRSIVCALLSLLAQAEA